MTSVNVEEIELLSLFGGAPKLPGKAAIKAKV